MKKRRVCRQSVSSFRRVHLSVTKLGLIPYQGEKKLRECSTIVKSRASNSQQMTVIPITQSSKLQEIAEILLKQQTAPIQPGQNLVCSIDAETLNTLLTHINQISSASTSTSSIQFRLDDLDASYDWELDRSKLTETTVQSNVNEPLSTLSSQLSFQLQPIQQPSLSQLAQDSSSYLLPFNNGLSGFMDPIQTDLATEHDLLGFLDMPNSVFDENSLIYY